MFPNEVAADAAGVFEVDGPIRIGMLGDWVAASLHLCDKTDPAASALVFASTTRT